MTGRSARPRERADLVLELFEGKAATWSAKYAPDGRLTGRLARLAEAVDGRVRSGGEVLDLGCGSGDLARQLAAAGYRVAGCDIAPRMLAQAAAADSVRGVSWIRLDLRWRALPFGPASLDAVVASSLLEYVSDPSAVLRECARVLRPGGVLLCTVPDVTHAMRWLEWPLVWIARMPLGGLSAGGWPRLASYLTYLRISRNRRTARWWRTAGRRAGLAPEPGPPAGRHRASLRLLTFNRSADLAGLSIDHRGQL